MAISPIFNVADVFKYYPSDEPICLESNSTSSCFKARGNNVKHIARVFLEQRDCHKFACKFGKHIVDKL